MTRLYTEQDGSAERLTELGLTVVGFGNQGRAQALNARDSGVPVTVASRADTDADRARADGFPVVPLAEAAGAGRVIAVLLPDEVIPGIFERDLGPAVRPGSTLLFASGFVIAFGVIEVPQGVDVVMVAPRMLGEGVRRNYVAGTGFPSLVAVERDATGEAAVRMLSYAAAIGALRMGAAVESSFVEEASIDLFTEHLPNLYELRAEFEVLTEAGFSPESVLLELYASGELIAHFRAVCEYGLWGQLGIHSPTSQYGQEVESLRHFDIEARKKELREILSDITSGAFTKRWLAESAGGGQEFRKTRDANRAMPMIQAERQLYERLGRQWRDGSLDDPSPAN